MVTVNMLGRLMSHLREVVSIVQRSDGKNYFLTFARNISDSKNVNSPHNVYCRCKQCLTSSNCQCHGQISSNQRSSIIRGIHNDMEYPCFDKYRRASTKNPEEKVYEHSFNRRAFSYIPVAFMFTAGIYATKTVVTQLITSMSPSAEVMAMSKAEIKLGGIEPGTMQVIKWRGKPLFVKHRLPQDWETERKVPLASLRDPQRDEDRVKKPEWLVQIGVCTHLGCVPISNAGDFNAYFCPCHGSHFDHSGRVRKGPAPRNLEIPPYEFLDENTILVG